MTDTIVEALTVARKVAGRSLADVAEHAGVATNSVCRWECGHGLPGLTGLRAWAGALGYELVLVKREG